MIIGNIWTVSTKEDVFIIDLLNRSRVSSPSSGLLFQKSTSSARALSFASKLFLEQTLRERKWCMALFKKFSESHVQLPYLWFIVHINNSHHLARKYAWIFVRGHYLFWETVSYEEQIMSKDKYPSIFSPQMEAVVYIILQIFFAIHAVLKIGEYLTIIPWARVGYEMIDSQRGA